MSLSGVDVLKICHIVPRPGAATVISWILVNKEESEVCINTYVIVTKKCESQVDLSVERHLNT